MNPTFSTFPSKRLPCPCLSSTTLVRMIFIHFAGCEWTSLFVNIVIRGILKVAFSPNSFREQNVKWNWIGDEILVFCPGFWDRLGVEKQSYWALVCTHLFASDEIFPQSWKNGSIEYWTLEKTTADEKNKICFKTCRSIIWILIFLIIQQLAWYCVKSQRQYNHRKKEISINKLWNYSVHDEKILK